MTPDWQREVDELHEFFQALFLDEVDSVDRAAAAFGPDFTFVGPDGALSDREGVLRMLEMGRGHSAGLNIGVIGHRTIVETAQLIVGEYIEVHEFADGSNRRRSTVVFDVDESGPNGVQWRHVQETWLAEPGEQ